MHTTKTIGRGEKGSEVKHTRKETFSILFEKKMYEKIKSRAEAEHITISDWLVNAARNKLNKGS